MADDAGSSTPQDGGTSTGDASTPDSSTPDPSTPPNASDADSVQSASSDANQSLPQTNADGSDAGAPSCSQAEAPAETGDLGVTVTDAATSQPISGADVQISGPTSAQAASDDSGTANFTGVPVGDYSISASKDGYSAGSGSGSVAANTSATATVALTASAQPVGDLSVSVTDSASSQPISGADVQISGPTSAQSASDDSGTANFTGIPAGDYSISVSKDGYSAGSGSGSVAASSSATAAVPLTASAPATGDLGVTVTDSATSQPISGANVEISGAGSGTATTDDSGTASFSTLQPGDYSVSASKDGYSAGSGTATVSAAGSATAAVSLTPSTGALGVTVTDATTSQPVSGVSVELSGAGSGTATTDDSGIANFSNLQAGDYTIAATKDGYENGSGSATVTASVTGSAAVALTGKVGSLGVTVTDASTNQPIQGANVSVQGPTSANGVTDASGVASIDNLPPGDYTIAAVMTNYTDGSGTATVTSGSSQMAAVPLTPLPGVLVVTVTDNSSAPNPPVPSAAIQISGAGSANGVADATGVFTFNALAPGAYTIAVTATDFQAGAGAATVTAGGSVPVTVPLTPVDCTQPAFNPANVTVASGAAPSNPLGACTWGLTHAENVQVTIRACKKAGQWNAILQTVTGNYSEQTRLLPGETEVTGPGGNTNAGNFCPQVTQLKALGSCSDQWYMLSAVVAHENVHATRLLPALQHASVTPVLQAAIEALSVPDSAGMTKDSAAAAIQALPGFAAALSAALTNWTAQYHVLIANDHNAGGPTDTAEHGVVDPMIQTICAAAKANGWGACAVCPP